MQQRPELGEREVAQLDVLSNEKAPRRISFALSIDVFLKRFIEAPDLPCEGLFSFVVKCLPGLVKVVARGLAVKNVAGDWDVEVVGLGE